VSIKNNSETEQFKDGAGGWMGPAASMDAEEKSELYAPA
jgi:hypothetical protein